MKDDGKDGHNIDMSKITWENTGIKILVNENKYVLTPREKEVLKALLFKQRPPKNLRKKVK